MFEDTFSPSFAIMGITWSWREGEEFKMFEVCGLNIVYQCALLAICILLFDDKKEFL